LQAGGILAGGQNRRALGDAGDDRHTICGQAEGVGVRGLMAVLKLGQGNIR
jgi:hypothetical protein